jgi:hypothetical protein
MSYCPTAFVIHQEDFLQKRPPFGALLGVMAGRNLAELHCGDVVQTFRSAIKADLKACAT